MFAKKLTALVKTKFNVDINVYYTCFKTGSYFQLKCSTLFPLLSNVVYKFSCLRDANISYIGMTTRHLGTRIQEHLQHKTTKSAICDHFEIYQNCKLNNTDFNGFKVLRICNSEYATKIQEALLIKKTLPTTCVPSNFMTNRRVPKFSLNNCAQSAKKTFMCPKFCTNPVLNYTKCHLSTNLSNFLKLCLLYCQKLFAFTPPNRRVAEKNRLSGNTAHNSIDSSTLMVHLFY